MDEIEAIQAVIQTRTRAIAERNAEAAVAVLAPGIIAFEVAGPMQVPAAQARDIAVTQAWLDSFDGPPQVEIEDLAIHAAGDVAFCHSLNWLKGRMRDGREIDLRLRSTLGFRKIDGEWKVIHAHSSVPR